MVEAGVMEKEEMAALKTAKKQLRSLMHTKLSQVSEASVTEQCEELRI